MSSVTSPKYLISRKLIIGPAAERATMKNLEMIAAPGFPDYTMVRVDAPHFHISDAMIDARNVPPRPYSVECDFSAGLGSYVNGAPFSDERAPQP